MKVSIFRGFQEEFFAARRMSLTPWPVTLKDRHHVHQQRRGKQKTRGRKHNETDRQRKQKAKERQRKLSKPCVPESTAQTCAGRCARVTNRCGTQVDCGSCACDPLCRACFTCDQATGACVADDTQVGDDCGDPGQVCQGTGAFACTPGGTTCGACRTCQGDGTCSSICGGSGCCDAATCQLGTDDDACGIDGEACVTCAEQGTGQTCGGGTPSLPGVCGCTPTTGAAEGKDCGVIPDGCGGPQLDCGPCPLAGQPCTNNVCGPCVPDCTGKACGAGNDCNGICTSGTCTAPNTCGGGTPSTPGVCGCTPTTCAAQNQTCGTLFDGCSTTLTCTECTGCCSGNTCHAEGTSCASGQVCHLGACIGNGACGSGTTCNTPLGCGPATCGDDDIVSPEARSGCAPTVEGGTVCVGRFLGSALFDFSPCTRTGDCPVGQICAECSNGAGKYCRPVCGPNP